MSAEPEPTEPTATDPEPEPTEPDPVSEAVAKATKKANAEAAKWRKRAEENASKLEEAAKANESEQERLLREAREQARQEATQEYETKLRRTSLEAAAIRASAGKLRNPDDVMVFLNFDDIDGPDEMPDAIDALLAERPYLAPDEKRPSGSADATSRGTATGNHVSVGAAIKALRGG